ncbi:MAG: sigma-70 family RNA polymerase sigma factor [Sediminibacterium sp.]|nr:sigma-70 family RNA polymerase sigma factor [Sediminibacterium sp.]
MSKKYSDEDIMQALAVNDSEIIGVLYEKYYKMIFAHLHQLGCGSEDIKDIFQETVMVIYDKAQSGTFNLTSKLSTYLTAVSRFKFYKKNRNEKINSYTEFNDNELVDIPKDLEYHEEQEKLYQNIFRGLELLGKPCSTLLEAFYIHNFNLQQVADLLNYKNNDSTKTQKYKCLEKLKTILTKLNLN